MIKFIQIFTCLFLILSLSKSHAQVDGFDFIFGLGITTGGEKISEYPIIVTNEYGSHQSTESIKSGDTRIYFLGGKLYFINFPIGIQFTWNDHASWANDVEGLESNFKSNSIDVIPYFRYDKFSFGLGLTYYYYAEFVEKAVGNGINWQGNYKMDKTIGYIFEIDYVWDMDSFLSSFAIGARFTWVEFKPYQINGSNVGLFLYVGIF